MDSLNEWLVGRTDGLLTRFLGPVSPRSSIGHRPGDRYDPTRSGGGKAQKQRESPGTHEQTNALWTSTTLFVVMPRGACLSAPRLTVAGSLVRCSEDSQAPIPSAPGASQSGFPTIDLEGKPRGRLFLAQGGNCEPTDPRRKGPSTTSLVSTRRLKIRALKPRVSSDFYLFSNCPEQCRFDVITSAPISRLQSRDSMP